MPGGESILIVVWSSTFQIVALSLCITLGASYGNFCVNELFHLVFVQKWQSEFLAMWSSHVHVHTRDHSRHRNKEKRFFKNAFKSSISIWIISKMWTFCFHCMILSRNPEKIKDKDYFVLAFFNIVKFTIENNDVICFSTMFQIAYCIWHIWPAFF